MSSAPAHRFEIFAAVVPALLGWVAGSAWQLTQAELWATSAYALLLAGSAAAALAVWLLRRVRSAGLGLATLRAATFAICLAASFSSTGLRAALYLQGALNPALEGQDLLVVGEIASLPLSNEAGVRFRLDVERAELAGQPVVLPPRIELGWYTGFGGRSSPSVGAFGARQSAMALLADDQSPEGLLELQRQPQPLRAGERWQFTVRLKAPHGNRNPFGFDYELWLWEQGIAATGYVRAGKSDAPPQKLAGSAWSHPVDRARQAVRDAIFERVADRQLAGVIAALAMGDQNAIDRSDWDVFRSTGVAHLMSISGLHITMFAWASGLLVSGLWRRSAAFTPRLCLAWPASAAGAYCGVAMAAAYALFSGWGVPAQRTVLMLLVAVLLRQIGKRWPWPLVWLLVMAAVVVMDPWALTQAGFWLSFVAIGVLFATSSETSSAPNSGAAAAGNTRAEGLNRLKGIQIAHWAGQLRSAIGPRLTSATREQFVITLALTPLTLLLFNQVSVVGLLANALAIPWVTLLVTPLAMLGLLWPWLWELSAAAIGVLMAFLQALAALPMASLNVATAPLYVTVLGVFGGAVMALRLPWAWRLLGLPLLLPVLLWQPLRPAPSQFELLAADIGQGNSVLVRTARHSLLYDAGPRFSRDSDAGHRVLAPLLRALGERLDLLVLSHRDADHIGGAGAVLAQQSRSGLLSSIETGHPLELLRPVQRCVAGQSWVWDGVSFEVLHPSAADYGNPAKSNAMSCVLRISNGTRTALLVGDIEAPQELRLTQDAAQRAKLKADWLLVPHHGSKTSSSAEFLDAVAPRFAIVQSGYRNRFGHPVPPVLARYQERGISVVTSPTCGAALWASEQADRVQCQREVQPRYWQHSAR